MSRGMGRPDIMASEPMVEVTFTMRGDGDLANKGANASAQDRTPLAAEDAGE